MSTHNFEQLEAVATTALVDWLNKNVERDHIRFGMHDGRIACFIDLAADNAELVFSSQGTAPKANGLDPNGK
jgi:hypothetical protein